MEINIAVEFLKIQKSNASFTNYKQILTHRRCR